MRLHIHSKVDLITNSSTSIYTWVRENAIENIYQILENLYAPVVKDLNVHERFSVRVVPGSRWFDEHGSYEYKDMLIFPGDSDEELEDIEDILIELGAVKGTNKYSGHPEYRLPEEKLGAFIDAGGWKPEFDGGYDDVPSTDVEVIDNLTGQFIDFESMFYQIYTQDAWHD